MTAEKDVQVARKKTFFFKWGVPLVQLIRLLNSYVAKICQLNGSRFWRSITFNFPFSELETLSFREKLPKSILSMKRRHIALYSIRAWPQNHLTCPPFSWTCPPEHRSASFVIGRQITISWTRTSPVINEIWWKCELITQPPWYIYYYN